jgi:2-keto-4-pentenoate hydratase
MTPAQIAAAAAILLDRRQSREQGGALPDACRPLDIDSGFAVQAGVTAGLGLGISGWKCALPSPGRTVAAPLYAGSIHDTSPCPVIVRNGQVRVEPELAFVIAHDLPVRDTPYTAADVDAAISRTHMALELIDSRYVDHKAVAFPDNLADGLVNQGLFIGPQVDTDAASRATDIALRIRAPQAEERTLAGHHPDTHPRAPLYWLAEFLRSRGDGLRAGQVVITGSYAGAVDVPPATDLEIVYGELGSLHVHFTAR